MDHVWDIIANFSKDIPVFGIVLYHFFVQAMPVGILVLTIWYLVLQIRYLKYKWKKDVEKRGE